ncbi:hypothetical protein B9K03_12145, partial [Rothia sp. Olga]
MLTKGAEHYGYYLLPKDDKPALENVIHKMGFKLESENVNVQELSKRAKEIRMMLLNDDEYKDLHRKLS